MTKRHRTGLLILILLTLVLLSWLTGLRSSLHHGSLQPAPLKQASFLGIPDIEYRTYLLQLPAGVETLSCIRRQTLTDGQTREDRKVLLRKAEGERSEFPLQSSLTLQVGYLATHSRLWMGFRGEGTSQDLSCTLVGTPLTLDKQVPSVWQGSWRELPEDIRLNEPVRVLTREANSPEDALREEWFILVSD